MQDYLTVKVDTQPLYMVREHICFSKFDLKIVFYNKLYVNFSMFFLCIHYFALAIENILNYTALVKKIKKSRVDLDHFSDIFNHLCTKTRLLQTRAYTHHFGTSLLRHSVNVAYVSVFISNLLKLKVDHAQLIRGALLHDYYLYDCHDKNDDNKKRHLRSHPGKAALAAQEDLHLTKKEIDIIVKHMFPITLALPKTKESAIVCFSDKVCSIYELVTNIYKRAFLKFSFA